AAAQRPGLAREPRLRRRAGQGEVERRLERGDAHAQQHTLRRRDAQVVEAHGGQGVAGALCFRLGGRGRVGQRPGLGRLQLLDRRLDGRQFGEGPFVGGRRWVAGRRVIGGGRFYLGRRRAVACGSRGRVDDDL